jgi:uncharacterized protein (TIGR03435 family)
MRAALLLVVFAGSCLGQTDSPPPAFDVVSVKLDRHADTNELVTTKKAVVRPAYQKFRFTPGRVTCSLPLISIVAEAYSVKFWQVSGPDWLYDGVYDITASMPGNTPKETALLMLRSMLAERFGLKAHWDRKDMPTYALVVNKGGPRLKDSAAGGKSSRVSLPGKFTAQGLSMTALATWLTSNSDLPVIDRTGLTGMYDVALSWTQEYDDLAVSSADRGLFSAVESQLGLKIERSKSLLEVLSIEHVLRVPVEN